MKTIFISLLLVVCVFIQSCSVSTHLGKVSVPKPAKNETDAQVWFVYYKDQLDGYGGNAIAPSGAVIEEEGYTPSEGTYNQAAIDGYEQARLDRSVAEKKVMRRRAWGFGGGVTAITLLPFLILIPILHNANNPGA